MCPPPRYPCSCGGLRAARRRHHLIGPPRIPGQNPNGIQVYLRAGLKTHGPGLHDYPQFLADWSKFLTEHGAVVTGSLHAPLAEELSKVAVLVIYKGDAGYLSDEDRKALEAFIKRGGGIVSIHDALCGPDPAYFATLVGGAKKHGEVNYTLEANVPYTVVDSSSPLMKDIAGVTLRDEAFFNMTWATNPKIHVLATTVIDGTPSAGTHKGEVVPQIWTYEHSLAGGQPARAFVWMQGHKYANFSEPQIQNMLLRAIAWAGRHPVEELVDYRPPPRPQGPPGAQPPAASNNPSVRDRANDRGYCQADARDPVTACAGSSSGWDSATSFGGPTNISDPQLTMRILLSIHRRADDGSHVCLCLNFSL